MPGDKVKASAIYAEAFRLEGEVKRLQEALAAANAELAVWRDEDAREAKYEHVSQRCTKAEESLATALRERDTTLAKWDEQRKLTIAAEEEAWKLHAEVKRLRAALELYRHCRHASVECFCVKEARAALAAGGDRG